MPVTNYHSVNGGIFGETNSSGRLSYLGDRNGCVLGTSLQNTSHPFTARYKPFGSSLAQSGVAPSFRWNGIWGIRAMDRNFSEYYVRARHYTTNPGSWTARDPLWPLQPAYIYVNNNPLKYVDRNGMQLFANRPFL